MNSFEIKEDFLVDGNPVKIISGAIHYFRVVPEYWKDRLQKLKAMGCNTVETYVAWNVHEKVKGKFNFDGIADLGAYIRLAGSLGLMVIVRPSPYICAEWEFGGLPGWLMKEDGMRLRSSYEPYLNHIRDYYKELFKILTPLQVTHGGPIIMFQVENEYGAYGEDTSYLEALKDMMLAEGVDVPLITSDGPWDDYLSCGELPGVHRSANFGSEAPKQFKILKDIVGNKPLMCMEFWVGWFDFWGDKGHHVGDPSKHVDDLDEILSQGSVNIYMAHGGTNFGFMNGSNYYDELTPDVTSYDYGALITEDGEFTPMYHEFKKVISKYNKIPKVIFDTKIVKKAFGEATLKEKTGLFESIDEISAPVSSHYPMCMEKLDQSYGYVLYRAELKREGIVKSFRIFEGRDRAKVYADGQNYLTLYDNELLGYRKFKDDAAINIDRLDILMENMGRVNYGIMMERQRKGIDGAVLINGHQHYDWVQYSLPMEDLSGLSFTKGYTEGLPGFYRFEFENSEEQNDEDGNRIYTDTFLDLEGFGKGIAFINGFNLGRFWEKGPQKRLYIPGPLIKSGINEILVFETEGKHADKITLCDEPDLGTPIY